MKRTLGFGASVTLLSTVAMYGGAQAAESRAIEEVIVTAQKREQSLADVPVSVQALQGVELEAIGVRELNQVISSIPGASEGRALSAGARSYQIRGIPGYYGDATVGYYLDDAIFTVLNRNFAPVANAFDVDRVEVLRGPQGTLYGSGAMGGSIRFVTADPDLQDFVFRGNTGYTMTDDEGGDSEDNYYANAAVSVPIVEDVFAVRAAASYDFMGGYAQQTSVPRPGPPGLWPAVQPATFPGEFNETEYQNYRVKALFRPTEEFTAKVTFQHNKVENPLSIQLASIDPNTVYPSALAGEAIMPFADTEYDMVALFLSYDFGDFVLESSTGYLDRTASTFTPIFIPLPAQEVPTAWTSADSDTTSSELRLVSQSDGPLNWLIGGIYQDAMAREDIDANYFGLRPPGLCLNAAPPMGPPPPGPPVPGLCNFRNDETTYESESYALFGEISYELFDGKLIPLVGVRYYEDDRTFTNAAYRFAAGERVIVFDSEGPGVPGDVGEFDSTDGRFNLSYFPDDDVMFYLNVASGFRSGTFNSTDGIAAAAGIGVDVDFSVEPDQLWSYEIGSKMTFDTVSLELAAYYIDWTDVQLNFSGANQVQFIANAGDVIGQGIEYAISWAALDGLVLQLTGNFNSTELDELAPGFPASPGLEVGEQLHVVPEQTHRLAVNYERPLGASGLNFTFFSSYAFTDEQGDVSDALGRFGDSQELLSARIGIQAGNWGVRLVGDNLLGEDEPIQISGSGLLRTYPRTYGLELNFDF